MVSFFDRDGAKDKEMKCIYYRDINQTASTDSNLYTWYQKKRKIKTSFDF